MVDLNEKLMAQGLTPKEPTKEDEGKFKLSPISTYEDILANELNKIKTLTHAREVCTIQLAGTRIKVCITPDTKHFVVLQDCKLTLWGSEKKEMINSLECNAHEVLSISKDGNFILSSDFSSLFVVETLTLNKVHSIPYNGCLAGQISSDGSFIVGTEETDAEKKWVKIVYLDNPSEEIILEGHPESIYAIALSPNDKLVASGGMDRKIKIWSVGERKELFTLKGHASYVYALLFRSDNKHLISGGNDNMVKIWNLDTQEEEFNFKLGGCIDKLSLSQEEKYLIASTEDSKIVFINIEERRQEFTLVHQGTNGVNDISADDDFLITATDNGKLMVWNFKTIAEEWEIRHDLEVSNLCISPNGRIILITTDGSPKFKTYNLESRDIIFELEFGENIKCATFSADNKYIIFGLAH